MNELTQDEKLAIILKQCKKHHISAYEIGENTSLNTSGLHKILKGETKPRHKTLNIILEYLDKRIIGKDIPGSKNYLKDRTIKTNHAAEEDLKYTEGSKLLSAINRLENFLIDRHSDILKHHEKFGEALLLTLKDTEDIMNKLDYMKELQDNTEGSIDSLSTFVRKRLG